MKEGEKEALDKTSVSLWSAPIVLLDYRKTK
jgi:hypothetical protein